MGSTDEDSIERRDIGLGAEVEAWAVALVNEELV